jgi:hypothetical protein
MEYTLRMAEEIAKKLRDLPAIDSSNRRLNKQGVIQHLASEIATLQQRGYTVQQIAESLCGFGLEISMPTLKSYLQRVKGKRGKRRPKATAAAAPGTPAAERRSTSRPVPGSARKPNAESAPPSAGSTKAEFMAIDRERL